MAGLGAVAAGALVATVVLQGGDDGPDAAALLAAAPAKVEQAGGASVVVTTSFDTPVVDINVRGRGGVDFASGSGWITVTAFGQRIELRTDGASVFLRPNDDQTWLAVKADEAGALASLGIVPTDLVALVDELRDAGDIDDLGQEGGSRHLRVHVDRAASGLSALVASGATLPLEVWIDDDGLPTRLRTRGTRDGIGVVVTVELSEYGSPLGVAIPPEGATRDIEDTELERLLLLAPPSR